MEKVVNDVFHVRNLPRIGEQARALAKARKLQASPFAMSADEQWTVDLRQCFAGALQREAQLQPRTRRQVLGLNVSSAGLLELCKLSEYNRKVIKSLKNNLANYWE